MINKNVCKFPIENTSSNLSISCFVLETDKHTMNTKKRLKGHRLILIEQGEGEFLFDDGHTSFSAGSLIFGFEGETFSLLRGDDVKYIYIDFAGTRATSLLRRFGIFPATRKRDGLNGLIPFYKDSLLSTKPENTDIAAESVLLYTFSRLSEKSAAQNDILQKILDLTEVHFRDPELSLGDIAKEIGYNQKYLSHFFKEKMNISYTEYLRSVRFRYAISLFELGIISVKNVAFLSGFSDPLYFSSAFKKSIGVSPKDFIANISHKTE